MSTTPILLAPPTLTWRRLDSRASGTHVVLLECGTYSVSASVYGLLFSQELACRHRFFIHVTTTLELTELIRAAHRVICASWARSLERRLREQWERHVDMVTIDLWERDVARRATEQRRDALFVMGLDETPLGVPS